ncbi:hypothetical protein [Caballeronia sp. NCTM1]|uniref:hypothetical protein n=1 Tax=Caballeronia sp. NCTM1 TaxID=2921753 RepID=UPI002027AF75|nr:hypothetical protein [Caballeronia sp. NCTM1]
MTGVQVSAAVGVPVLPVIESDELSSNFSDNEFINAVCAAIPHDKRQEALAALLSIVGATH